MKNGQKVKNIGTALSIIGLIGMVAAFILDYPFKYIIMGLLIVSIGSLLNSYGKKHIGKD